MNSLSTYSIQPSVFYFHCSNLLLLRKAVSVLCSLVRGFWYQISMDGSAFSAQKLLWQNRSNSWQNNRPSADLYHLHAQQSEWQWDYNQTPVAAEDWEEGCADTMTYIIISGGFNFFIGFCMTQHRAERIWVTFKGLMSGQAGPLVDVETPVYIV